MRTNSILFLLTILFFISCKEVDHQPAEHIISQNRSSIIFLGDSLTAGYGLNLSSSYPSLIQEKINNANLPYKVINAGVSGDTTAAGLVRLKWYLSRVKNLSHIIISLGSNDAMRGVPIKVIKSNLRSMVSLVRKSSPNTKVYITQLETFPNLGVKYKSSYKTLFRRVATAEKVTLLPFLLEGVAGDPKLNQKDGIHPTKKGTLIVAENVWKSLKDRL